MLWNELITYCGGGVRIPPVHRNKGSDCSCESLSYSILSCRRLRIIIFLLCLNDETALCSGGKDSTFSIYKALQNGHTVECVVTIHPSTDDSMLFHYPNSRIVKSVARYADTFLSE